MRTLLCAALLSACAGDDPEGEKLPIGEWTELVAGDWALAPGEDAYFCATRTLAEDAHVSGFRPIAPAGTHHSVLSIVESPGPDGAGPCSAAVEGHRVVFASGLGTGELVLPEGVAATVPAGTQLHLNLHLVNPTPEPISARSGVSALLVEAARVQERAEVILAGKVDGLEVVPGPSTQSATCTFPGPSTLHAVMPHMHARGSRLRVASGSDVLFDQDFDVDAQHYAVLEPARELQAKDALSIECSYDNPTAQTLHFGPTADDEMCYAILVRHPALDVGPLCTK
jgi:hypothetical protein